MKMQTTVRVIFVLCMTIIIGIVPFRFSHAATAKETNVRVDVALARFAKEVKGAKEFLHAAKGVLVIPRVVQAGLVIGGEYGEGAMRIGGKTVGYYSIAAGSFGYQIGAREKDIILVFMDEAALNKFRSSDNWQAGVDGTVALGKIGAEGSMDTTKIKQPIVGFVFGQKGLMAGATIEGAKLTKLKK